MKKVICKILGISLLVLGMFSFCIENSDAGGSNIDKKTREEIRTVFAVLGATMHENFITNELSNENLINFGVFNAGFTPKKTSDDGRFSLPEKYVGDVVKKYFNRNVKHKSSANFPYKNGKYTAYIMYSEDYTRIEITGCDNLGDNKFVFYVSKFDLDNDNLSGKERATFLKIKSGGKSRYVIESYEILK